MWAFVKYITGTCDQGASPGRSNSEGQSSPLPLYLRQSPTCSPSLNYCHLPPQETMGSLTLLRVFGYLFLPHTTGVFKLPEK